MSLEKPNLPQVIDPETGLAELVGNGRVAVIKKGAAAVSRLVELPENRTSTEEPDVLEELVASGRLRNSS